MPPPSRNGAEPDRRRGALICDDFDAIRAALAEVVALSPVLQVIGEARDGTQAINETLRLRPDVILLDLAMPVMTGIEALPELRRVAPEATIIVISGFADAVVGDEVRALGADGYIEKGADINTILKTLEQATT